VVDTKFDDFFKTKIINNNMISEWANKNAEELFKEFETAENGLSSAEAAARLEKYGENKLPEGKRDSFWLIFFRQFQSPLVYILLVAAIIVFILKEFTDGFVIMGVLIFNAVVGAIQEGKAQNTLLALKKFAETRATVWRDGREIIIPSAKIVPGDIISLQAGEKVPAEARLIGANNLKVNEASLTGESKPVAKNPEKILEKNEEIIGQSNLVFKGTDIAAGNGQALVLATGTNTFIGRIAAQIAVVDTDVPLKADLQKLSRLIIFIVLAVSAFLFALGLFCGESPREMFVVVVSLAVSVIPEGLPIVMTLVLATGVWRMAKRQALVKRLQAVEALGQAKIIAVDKTGTITRNELIVQKAYVGGRMFEIGGIGYEPEGEVRLSGKMINPADFSDLIFAGKVAALSADARITFEPKTKQWRVAGDPTEAAMLVLAQKLGFRQEDLQRDFKVLAAAPFDYRLKYRAASYEKDSKRLITLSGAPETILNLCGKIYRDGHRHDFKEGEKKELEKTFFDLSRQGLRVVALAEERDDRDIFNPEKTKNLSFVGFLGMRDAIRPEVAGAMRQASEAGIRVIMITGDHAITAKAVAREAGIYKDGDEVLTGKDLDGLSDEKLANKLDRVSVFARVNPEHKLKIIQAFKARGEIIAMTGDGVNDAPSLVAADLGVAMGVIGTEVAKEASDIILLDDNFGSIVSAVEEGRSIYKTIKKVILYLFSTNISELLVIIVALALGWPLPILAAQIIWLNVVTDGFLDVSLAMEPKEPGLLRDHIVKKKRGLVDGLMARRMTLMALPMAAVGLLLFKDYYAGDLDKARTVCMSVMAIAQVFNALNCRFEKKSIFQTNPFSNWFLVIAIFVSSGLQVLAVYAPALQGILRTAPLAARDWALIIPAAASVLIVEEMRKLVMRLRDIFIKKIV